jgi:hypothetical protein
MLLVNFFHNLLLFYVYIYNYLINIFNLIKNIFYIKYDNIYIISNAKIITNYSKNNYLKKLNNFNNNNLLNHDTFIIHKIEYNNIIYYCNNFILLNPELKNNYTTYSFILIQITSNNNTYDLTKFLKNSYDNYYIINNILFDINFMNWIIINKYNIDLYNYTIDIIDNNVENIKLTPNNYIKLNLNNYEIIDIII